MNREGPFWHFRCPTEIFYGVDRSLTLGKEVKRFGKKKVMLVTDAGIKAAGVLDGAIQSLSDESIDLAVFDQSPIDPTDKDIDNLVSIIKQEGCDCVVGAGGGSIICLSKAAALVANNKGPTRNHFGLDNFENPSLLCIIIPTAAGSGAEVSVGTTLTDSQTHKKARIMGYEHAVRLAILDPVLLLSSPRPVTIACGVDALTHAIEGYLAENANPITDAMALEAIRIMMANFCHSVFTIDLEAKEKMLVAATMASLSCSNSRIGLAHILNGVITYIMDTKKLAPPMSYGMMYGILLPPVLEFNLVACESKVPPLAQAMGLVTRDKSLLEIRADIMKRLDSLLTDLGTPRRFTWKDLSAEEVIAVGIKNGPLNLDMAKQEATIIRKYTKEDLIAILQKMLPN
ncbi:iron-containing alcohol dehydrogenase [Thermodesulfobacteriota bacterium]